MLNPISTSLERYMTFLSDRQKLVASNIANADTPGYKTLDVDFQSELAKFASNDPRPPAAEVQGLTVKNDGNNVSLDREARLLAENAIRFSVASNFLHSQVKLVRLAIDGGGTSS